MLETFSNQQQEKKKKTHMLASIVGLGLLGYYFSSKQTKDSTLSGRFPPAELRSWFADNHSLYPKDTELSRLDPFIPKFPQTQGNPDRKDPLQGLFPDPNAVQSRIIDKTGWVNWGSYAGQTSDTLLFDGKKNNALIENKYNQDDWCWGITGNGQFMSPLYLQQQTGNRPALGAKLNPRYLL